MADKENRLLCKVIIEVAGKPKEHIENTLRLVLKKIKDEETDIKFKQGDLYKAKEVNISTEQKGQIWSTFTELELYMKDVETLIGFCFTYMPSSIEILEPQDIRFNLKDFSDLLTELLARLHQIGIVLKNLNAEKEVLNRNAASLLRNIVMISLRKKEKTLDEIAKFSGIDKNKLKPFIDEFVNMEFLKESDGKYSLVR